MERTGNAYLTLCTTDGRTSRGAKWTPSKIARNVVAFGAHCPRVEVISLSLGTTWTPR